MKKILLILMIFVSVYSYGQIPLMGDIVPASTLDTYPMVNSLYVQGGFTSVATIAIRDDDTGALDPTGITLDRRTEGMFVYVVATAKFYQLQGGIQNANWVHVKLGDDVLLEMDDHVFDTLRLSNHDTKIWQLRMSATGDTLFYNNIAFVGGNSSSSFYIDVDRPLNILANGTNIKDMVGYTPMRLDSLVEMVFYAAQPPQASLSGSGDHSIEYGSTNNISLSWTATKTSNPITAITVAGESMTVTGNTQSGTKNVTVPSNTNTTYNMLVTESTNLTASASTSYAYYNRCYIGLEATSLTPPDAYYDAITDAAIMAYPYDDLRSSYYIGAPYSIINPTGGFIVIVAPTAFGQPKSWPEGGSESMAIPFTLQKTWNMVNQYGYSTEYKMWVIPNKQNSNPSNFFINEN